LRCFVTHISFDIFRVIDVIHTELLAEEGKC